MDDVLAVVEESTPLTFAEEGLKRLPGNQVLETPIPYTTTPEATDRDGHQRRRRRVCSRGPLGRNENENSLDPG